MTARLGKSPESKSRPKQIGFPPFNTGRKYLPVKSDAGKLKAFRFRKMNLGKVRDVRLSKGLDVNRSK
jgi:hypothetical protein